MTGSQSCLDQCVCTQNLTTTSDVQHSIATAWLQGCTILSSPYYSILICTTCSQYKLLDYLLYLVMLHLIWSMIWRNGIQPGQWNAPVPFLIVIIVTRQAE